MPMQCKICLTKTTVRRTLPVLGHTARYRVHRCKDPECGAEFDTVEIDANIPLDTIGKVARLAARAGRHAVWKLYLYILKGKKG